jgi:hypothetical protein
VRPWTIEVSGKLGVAASGGRQQVAPSTPRSALSITCTVRDRLGVSEMLLLPVPQALIFDLGMSALVPDHARSSRMMSRLALGMHDAKTVASRSYGIGCARSLVPAIVTPPRAAMPAVGFS